MPMSEYMRSLRAKVGRQLLEVPAASVAIRDDEGRVLMVRHSEGNVWVLPGGGIEPLEVPADAAVREAYEETGLLARVDRIVGVYGGPEFVVSYANGDTTSYLMVVFAGRAVGGELRPDGEEVLEAAYWTAEDARELALPRWMPAVLDDVFGASAAAGYRRPTWTPRTGP